MFCGPFLKDKFNLLCCSMFDICHWPDFNVDAHANISVLFHLSIMPLQFKV